MASGPFAGTMDAIFRGFHGLPYIEWDDGHGASYFSRQKGAVIPCGFCVKRYICNGCCQHPFVQLYLCVRYERLESMYEHHPANFLGLVVGGTLQHGGPFVPGDGDGKEF